MNQTQCPNCGGYKAGTKILYVDPSDGQVVEPRGKPSVSFMLICVIATFGLALPSVLVWLWYNAKRKKKEDLIQENHSECEICGYQWRWREGERVADVTTRPGLIAKGNRLLEEERRDELLD